MRFSRFIVVGMGATSERKMRSAAGAILDGGAIAELVYDAVAAATSFAVCDGEHWTIQAYLDLSENERLVPFSPNNNLIKNDAVLLPSAAADYGSETELVDVVRSFIHRYADLSPAFETIGTYYVLLTWLYDVFNEVPYLRLRGDYGTGKTRTLLTLGSLCYKAFFASGASTVSPIFHTLDAFRGTLVFDEADFRFSDERAEVVKILNNGNVRGVPLLRTTMNQQKEFNPRAFQVFGPKIVATRGQFEDKALESRFLTEEMGGRPLRDDIPINLPPAFKEEARAVRNKLLMYRFHKRPITGLDETLLDPALEPRLNQILLPLLSVVDDADARAELRSLARDMQAGLVAERGMQAEAQVIEVLADLIARAERTVVPIADVVSLLAERYGEDYERPLTNRWVGGVLRKRLNVQTYKSHGVFVVPITERTKVMLLCRRYGVDLNERRYGGRGEVGDGMAE